MKVLDSTFLIDVLRGDGATLAILNSKESLLTTQINMYEIIRGLFLRNVSSRHILDIMGFFDKIRVLSLDDGALVKAAELSAMLIKEGKTLPDCDCLMAGIALSNGIETIVTRNAKDFRRINGLRVETY